MLCKISLVKYHETERERESWFALLHLYTRERQFSTPLSKTFAVIRMATFRCVVCCCSAPYNIPRENKRRKLFYPRHWPPRKVREKHPLFLILCFVVVWKHKNKSSIFLWHSQYLYTKRLLSRISVYHPPLNHCAIKKKTVNIFLFIKEKKFNFWNVTLLFSVVRG